MKEKKLRRHFTKDVFPPRASRGRFSGLTVATRASFWWQNLPETLVFSGLNLRKRSLKLTLNKLQGIKKNKPFILFFHQ